MRRTPMFSAACRASCRLHRRDETRPLAGVDIQRQRDDRRDLNETQECHGKLLIPCRDSAAVRQSLMRLIRFPPGYDEKCAPRGRNARSMARETVRIRRPSTVAVRKQACSPRAGCRIAGVPVAHCDEAARPALPAFGRDKSYRLSQHLRRAQQRRDRSHGQIQLERSLPIIVSSWRTSL